MRSKPNMLVVAGVLTLPAAVAWVLVIWAIVTFGDAGIIILEIITRSI